MNLSPPPPTDPMYPRGKVSYPRVARIFEQEVEMRWQMPIRLVAGTHPVGSAMHAGMPVFIPAVHPYLAQKPPADPCNLYRTVLYLPTWPILHTETPDPAQPNCS